MEYLSLVFSISSLAISFITLYRQRKHIDVTWDPNVIVLNPKTDITVLNEPYPANSSIAFFTTLKIVNSSRCDMAFFDLRAFNPLTNENHYTLTKRTIIPHLKDLPILVSPSSLNKNDNGPKFFITIPDRNSGTLKAGSFTQIDILIYVNQNIKLNKNIMISFKITDTSLFRRSPYSNTNRKKYKTFDHNYCIDGYEKLLPKTQEIDSDNKSTH
jgi:hypothetical protein